MEIWNLFGNTKKTSTQPADLISRAQVFIQVLEMETKKPHLFAKFLYEHLTF